MWTIGIDTHGFTADQVVFLFGLYLGLRVMEQIFIAVADAFECPSPIEWLINKYKRLWK